jgi:hypothetical protein
MADDELTREDGELTREEVFLLARTFPVATAKTLLSLARFPSWAVPETGYANALEFWTKIAEQLAAGVMEDGRGEILRAASEWFPANQRLAALAAAAGRPGPASTPTGPDSSRPSASGSRASGSTVSVTGGQGFVIGDHAIQINIGAVPPGPADPTDSAAADT